MPRKNDRKPPKQVGNPGDPQGMAVRMDQFLEWMSVMNYSERTVGNRKVYLSYFIEWAEDRGLSRPNEITKPILERYQRYLYHYRKKDGDPLSFRSQHGRHKLLLDPNNVTLFLSNLGEGFTANRLTQLVRVYVDAADMGKSGSCHLFRHTMATLMLENGADVRFIQAMLGHAKLETTQIYTQVSIRKLKEIHEATHPAKLQRDGDDPVDETPEEDSDSTQIKDQSKINKDFIVLAAITSDQMLLYRSSIWYD